MKGTASVSGNVAVYQGGGVYVGGTGSFTMEETASVSGNIAKGSSNGTPGDGGGVYVDGGASFTMSDGTISGNTAGTIVGGSGGGVYVSTGGFFTQTGNSIIYGDTDTIHTVNSDENTAASSYGHAVYVNGSPGKQRNSTAHPGANLDSSDLANWDEFVWYVASSGNDSTGNGSGTAPFESVQKAVDVIAATYATRWPGYQTDPAPARILVSGDIVTGGATNGLVDISDSVLYNAYPPIILTGKGPGTNAGTLDATGHSKRVLYIDNADLTLGDNLTLTGGDAANDGGGVYIEDGNFTMIGNAAISDNEAVGDGGGVYAYFGNITISGNAVISGNEAGGNGGGMLMYNGNIIMSGGTVSGNQATQAGGGVYIAHGNITMSGGTISDNTASTNGGGVYVAYDGAFEMGGGIITGGAVYPYSGTTYPANTAGSGKALYNGSGTGSTWGLGGTGNNFAATVNNTIHVLAANGSAGTTPW
jgi:hypothetical protein